MPFDALSCTGAKCGQLLGTGEFEGSREGQCRRLNEKDGLGLRVSETVEERFALYLYQEMEMEMEGWISVGCPVDHSVGCPVEPRLNRGSVSVGFSAPPRSFCPSQPEILGIGRFVDAPAPIAR